MENSVKGLVSLHFVQILVIMIGVDYKMIIVVHTEPVTRVELVSFFLTKKASSHED